MNDELLKNVHMVLYIEFDMQQGQNTFSNAYGIFIKTDYMLHKQLTMSRD